MEPTIEHSILWRRLDQPGHDFVRLSSRDEGWELAGSAAFSEEGTPCGLNYVLACDANWRTTSGRIDGWIGGERVAVDITADPSRRWRMNGVEFPELDGCVDLDFGFTPATNFLPIRRLAPAVGERSSIRSAWIPFPDLRPTPLDQTYRRIGPDTYEYEAPSLDFKAELRVNRVGMIVNYAGLWTMETDSPMM